MSAMLFGHVDWGGMFVPKHALIDSVIRGSAVYLMLFALLRVLKNRSVGGVGMSDLLVVILVANALQNGLIGHGSSITEGLVSTLTVVGWSSLVERAAYRWRGVRRLVRARPVPVVRDGAVVPAGLRRERMTEDALLSALRLEGVSGIEAVRAAYVEENGAVSVVKR